MRLARCLLSSLVEPRLPWFHACILDNIVESLLGQYFCKLSFVTCYDKTDI